MAWEAGGACARNLWSCICAFNELNGKRGGEKRGVQSIPLYCQCCPPGNQVMAVNPQHLITLWSQQQNPSWDRGKDQTPGKQITHQITAGGQAPQGVSPAEQGICEGVLWEGPAVGRGWQQDRIKGKPWQSQWGLSRCHWQIPPVLSTPKLDRYTASVMNRDTPRQETKGLEGKKEGKKNVEKQLLRNSRLWKQILSAWKLFHFTRLLSFIFCTFSFPFPLCFSTSFHGSMRKSSATSVYIYSCEMAFVFLNPFIYSKKQVSDVPQRLGNPRPVSH